MSSMGEQRSALEKLGFRIVEETEDRLVAVAKRFHWECMLTRITYVVFVRKVEVLTPALIEADRADLQKRAKQLDPSLLPYGLQKGHAVLACYLAESVNPHAQALCDQKPKARFAFFYVPAALDRSTGRTHLVQKTPVWGGLYYSKFRFLIQRLFNPALSETDTWPISNGGVVMTLALLAMLAYGFRGCLGVR